MKTMTLFIFSLLLTACSGQPRDENSFACEAANEAPLAFAFDTQRVWVDNILFDQQKWIGEKEINATTLSLIWEQPLLLLNPKTGGASKVRLFFDYQFDVSKRTLSVARYIQEPPASVSAAAIAPHEKVIQYACQKIDFLSPLRALMSYASFYLEKLFQ